jgi:hypothetical protein
VACSGAAAAVTTLVGQPAAAGTPRIEPAPFLSPSAKLQLASFGNPEAARRFVEAEQLAWNDCWVARQLGVPVPGTASVPGHCTARAQVALLHVEPAVVEGRRRYRVRTSPIPVRRLWGAVNAYRLAGHSPVVVK